MVSQDLVRYNPCKFVDPNKLSNYDLAMCLITVQSTVWLIYKATHTADLNKVSIVINNPFWELFLGLKLRWIWTLAF